MQARDKVCLGKRAQYPISSHLRRVDEKMRVRGSATKIKKFIFVKLRTSKQVAYLEISLNFPFFVA